MIKRLFFFFLVPFAVKSQPLQVSTPLRFLALGDSYTIGQSVGVNERWPVQLSDSLVSRGIATDTMRIIATTGWRTDDLLNAITGQHLQQQHYNLVSLLIGVNNQYQARPFSQYITEFPALLDSAIRYAGDTSRVFVVSIPDYAYTPFGQQSSNPSQISSELAQYNQYNKRVADSMHVRYFNITPISQQGIQNPSYVANDGLHPSGAQYAQWVKLMLDVIDSELAVTVIREAENERLVSHIVPNPTTGGLAILTDQHHALSITVLNSTGQLVEACTASGPMISLSLYDQPAGLYTLRISDGRASETKKIVKQ